MSSRTSKRFAFKDADLIIRSVDAVEFRLHRQNLATHTEAFPGAEFGTAGEIVELSEDSEVLEILFQFVYPERFPKIDLKETICQGNLMLALAEAVEKYQVIQALSQCTEALSTPTMVHGQPVGVLAYAMRHGYPTLANAVSPLLYLQDPRGVVQHLPAHDASLWLEYRDRCFSTIFKAAEEYFEGLKATEYCVTIQPPHQVCSICRTCLLTWFSHLQTIPSEPELHQELQSFSRYPSNVNHTFCGSECMYSNRCDHALQMAKLCEEGLQTIYDISFVSDPQSVDPQAFKLPLTLSK